MKGVVGAGVFLAMALSPRALLAGEFGVGARAKEQPRRYAGERSGHIDVFDVTAKPLRDVLSYIARYSGGFNIIPRTPEIGAKKISITLFNVFWRDALDTIAELNGLRVDETRSAARILIVDEPPRVVLKAPDADVREVIMMIAEAARANIVLSPKVQGRITVKLENIPWQDALDIIVKTTNFVMVREPHNIIRIAAPEELKQQLETRVFRLSYVEPKGSKYVAKIQAKEYVEQIKGTGSRDLKAASLVEVLDKVKSEAGRIAFEKRTNSLVITDTAQKLEVIEGIITELDIPPKQVHLSTKLVELNDEDAESLGINWQNGLTFSASGMSMSTTYPFDHGAGTDVTDTWWGEHGVIGPSGGRAQTLASPGWTFAKDVGDVSWGTLDFTQLIAVLGFLRTQTRGKVIQAPQITALDHEPATIHVGRLVRYAESFVETTEGGGRVSGFREAQNSPVRLGIQILVVPHVTGPANNVLLTVIPKTESPTGAELFEKFQGGGGTELKLPQTTQRIIVTKMMLRDGETGVIAGLREEWEGETITKIPILGDIPLIGWLFMSRDRPRETNKVSNLIIFVTPKVIDFERRGDLEAVMELSRTELSRAFAVYEAEAGGVSGP